MQQQIYAGRTLREFARGQRYAAFLINDGTAHLGRAVVDEMRVDQPARCYFQSACSIYEVTEVKVWTPLQATHGPCESWPIWKAATEHPAMGEIIVYWDTDAIRQSYSGPYWHVGTFGTENRRFQNASGPFVSGEPWSGVKSWATLEELVSWLGLRDVPWIKTDTRAGQAAFAAALREANIRLKGLYDDTVDLHFEKYGFSFLETEEQAVAFIDELVSNSCSKGCSAKHKFDAFTKSGVLEEVGLTRLEIAIKALSSARRTHCGCHETGSFLKNSPLRTFAN